MTLHPITLEIYPTINYLHQIDIQTWNIISYNIHKATPSPKHNNKYKIFHVMLFTPLFLSLYPFLPCVVVTVFSPKLTDKYTYQTNEIKLTVCRLGATIFSLQWTLHRRNFFSHAVSINKKKSLKQKVQTKNAVEINTADKLCSGIFRGKGGRVAWLIYVRDWYMYVTNVTDVNKR